MREPAGPGPDSPGAIQARLDQQIPQLYRDLALYLQVLREVLPASLDQACSHMATQVRPRRYNHLPPEVRQQLHGRLKSLVGRCSTFLTVEQLLHLASQMVQERQRLAEREHVRLLRQLERGGHDQPGQDQSSEGDLRITFSEDEPLPSGSIQLQLNPPLGGEPFPLFPHSPTSLQGESEREEERSTGHHLGADLMAALADNQPAPVVPWATGQLPRDPAELLHCLERWEVALSRRLRNLSHSVNLELMRVGLLVGVVPVPLLDAVLTGQIEPQGAPANLLRLPMVPAEGGTLPSAPMGVLLRTVDLEMEQPRLRTCRRRLLHHRQEIHKMAETSHRLQRRLQVHHAERLWRHDSQLNPPPPA